MGIDVHRAESKPAKEVAVFVFTKEHEVVNALDVKDYLFCKVLLRNNLFQEYFSVSLDREPAAGIGTLVVTRAQDKRHLVVLFLQPEEGPAVLFAEFLRRHKRQAGVECVTVYRDAFLHLTVAIVLNLGNGMNPAAVADKMRPQFLDQFHTFLVIETGKRIRCRLGSLSRFPQNGVAKSYVFLSMKDCDAQTVHAFDIKDEFPRRIVCTDYLVEDFVAVGFYGDYGVGGHPRRIWITRADDKTQFLICPL